MATDVYKYSWEYFDGAQDGWVPVTSKIKVTRSYVTSRAKDADPKQVRNYQVIDHTVEQVPEESVVEDVYHPELHRKGFQRQVNR